MTVACYIGDEATAAGFRLAGARVIVPGEGEERAALAAARGDAALVLVSADVAARIPADDMAAAQAALAPLVVTVPDLQERVALPDVAARLRRELGVEAAE